MAGELRLALFEEGSDALAIVLGESQPAHFISLQVEFPVERAAPAGADHLFDRGKSKRRECRQFSGNGVNFPVQGIVVDRLPDQAPFGCLIRRKRLACKREAKCSRLANQSG